jgi:hypothetical protein
MKRLRKMNRRTRPAWRGQGGLDFSPRAGRALRFKIALSVDDCTAHEPRPTNGRPEAGPNRLALRFIHQANIKKRLFSEKGTEAIFQDSQVDHRQKVFG